MNTIEQKAKDLRGVVEKYLPPIDYRELLECDSPCNECKDIDCPSYEGIE